jgi:hypothetical protein
MKRDSYELLDDWFLNLYEEWIFVRSFEYTAILLSELTWYRLFGNIDKKTWKIFIECAFPKTKINEIINILERQKQNIRLVKNDWNIEQTIFWNNLKREKEKLIQIKKQLIFFE